jgi:uncharacterized membrane protein
MQTTMTSTSEPSDARASKRGSAGRKQPRAVHPVRSNGSNGQPRTQRLANGLGWLSIGLGLAELLAPRRMARMVGIPDDRRARRAMTLMGLRELACGVGLMASSRRSPWLWARVGGDLVDLAVLRAWGSSRRNDQVRLRTVLTAVAGITVLDAVTARRTARMGHEPFTATAVATIARTPAEVYQFWRNFENLPRFMEHLASVKVIDSQRSHWKVIGPADAVVEWDAEIVEDRPDQAIEWRTLPGADVDNSGIVRFLPAPGGRGTEVHVELSYGAPGGEIGRAIAKLVGREPGQQARGDLRRLKQVLETGAVVHSDASIHRGPHPARPPSRAEIAELGLVVPRLEMKEAAQ